MLFSSGKGGRAATLAKPLCSPVPFSFSCCIRRQIYLHYDIHTCLLHPLQWKAPVMKRSICCFALSVWLQSSSVTFASIGFGAGTQYLVPAYTAPRGSLFLGTHTRTYFIDQVHEEAAGISTGRTYWDIQGGLGLTYGLAQRFELGLSQIYYQDNHKAAPGYNLPDDLFLHFKLGSLGPATGNLRYGLQAQVRLPTAQYHNIPWEYYSAGRIGIGVTALASIISEPAFPESGMNVHFNLGLFRHNDLAARLIDDVRDTLLVERNTEELVFGAAYTLSREEFGFLAELYGRTFLHKPPYNAYTRETTIYFVPGITYTPYAWVKFRVALDIRVVGGNDETRYDGHSGSYAHISWKRDLNMPFWRIGIGALFSLNPKKVALVRRKDKVLQQAKSPAAADGKSFEDLASERKKTENAESELERIRTERQRMQDLLERLRKILETPPSSGKAEQEKNSKEQK